VDRRRSRRLLWLPYALTAYGLAILVVAFLLPAAVQSGDTALLIAGALFAASGVAAYGAAGRALCG
jgi:hypothetical protein